MDIFLKTSKQITSFSNKLLKKNSKIHETTNSLH